MSNPLDMRLGRVLKGRTSMVTQLFRIAFASTIAAAIVLAGPASANVRKASETHTEGASPTTLTVDLPADPQTLDPARSTVANDLLFTNQIYNNLVGANAKFELVPELATSWKLSSDGKVATFVLRRGVRFHDGTPFNAQAVVFNFRRVLSPAIVSPQKSYISAVQRVAALNAYTVRFTLSRPSGSFLAALGSQVGQIVSPAALRRYGDDFGAHPSGTGPFKFVEWVRSDHVLLTRNNTYWEKAFPKVDRLRFNIVPDPAVAVTAVRTGQADVMLSPPANSLSSVLSTPSVRLVRAAGLRTDFISLNSSKPPFNNEHLRRAVNLAISRSTLTRGLFAGNAGVAHGLLSPAQWGFDSRFVCATYSPNAVRQELATAGMPNGFSFDLISINQPDILQSMEAVQAQLAQFGIRMNIIPVLISQVGAINAAGNFEAIRLYAAGRIDPGIQYADTFANLQNLGSGRARIASLLTQADGTSSQSRRTAVLRQLEKYICDNSFMIYLYRPVQFAVVRSNVRNFVLPADGKLRLKGTSRAR